MYSPHIESIRREGSRLFIETYEPHYYDVEHLKGIEEIPFYLDGKQGASPFCTVSPDGTFEPIETTEIVFTSGKRGIAHRVLDIELVESRDEETNRIDHNIVYTVQTAGVEEIKDFNAATHAIYDELLNRQVFAEVPTDKLKRPLILRDVSSPLSIKPEYVVPKLFDYLTYDGLQCRYKFTVEMNNNLVSLEVAVMEDIPLPIVEDETIFITLNLVNGESTEAWVSMNDNFRIVGKSYLCTHADKLSSGRVGRLLNQTMKLAVHTYKMIVKK